MDSILAHHQLLPIKISAINHSTRFPLLHIQLERNTSVLFRRALEQAESAARKQSLLKPLTPRGLNSPSKSPHKGYKVKIIKINNRIKLKKESVVSD